MVAQGGLIASPHGAISSQSIVLGHPAPAIATHAVGPAYAAPALAATAYGFGLGSVKLHIEDCFTFFYYVNAYY